MNRFRTFKHHDDRTTPGASRSEPAADELSAGSNPGEPALRGPAIRVVDKARGSSIGPNSAAEKMKTTPPGDTLAARLGLMFFGIVVSLVLFEAAFRLFASESAQQLSSADSPAWRDRPDNFYMPETTVDNRDYFYPPAKSPGTFRVVVVGDSFTFGGKGQFDDTFPKRLERMLNLNRNQRKVEVLNWGVPGFSTRQEELLVRRAERDFGADLVVLEITLNDPELKPYRITHSFQDNKGDVILRYPIFDYWKSLGFVVRRIFNTVTHEDYKQYYFDLFENHDTWNNFTIGIRRIQQISAANHVPVLAVVFPLFSHQLDDRYPFAPLHKKISSYLGDQSFPLLDLLPFYHNIPPERLQAIPGKDSHPNEIAHRIAADAIYQELVRRSLIPAEVQIKKIYPGSRKLAHKIPDQKYYESLKNGAVSTAPVKDNGGDSDDTATDDDSAAIDQ